MIVTKLNRMPYEINTARSQMQLCCNNNNKTLKCNFVAITYIYGLYKLTRQ
jgi:hypothetical protein